MSQSKKDQVKKIFGKNADSYAKSVTHSTGKDLEILLDWLQPNSNAVCLDLATGGGNVARLLAPHTSRVFATDLTKDMLQNTSKYLTAFNNIDYVVADAENIPFLDASFDVVTCRIAAHHFPNPESFIKEVFRVLKPNGSFILIDNVAPDDPTLAHFMNSFEEKRDPSHARALSVSEWTKFFSTNHLTILKENLYKKQLPFDAWVNRTTENEAQVKDVRDQFADASSMIKKHFQFIEEDGRISSFTLDQWMVLCKKES